MFRNNIVRHVSSVFNILGRDNLKPSQLTNDIEIRNNVFEDVSKATYGGDGRMMLINGADNVRVPAQYVVQLGHRPVRLWPCRDELRVREQHRQLRRATGSWVKTRRPETARSPPRCRRRRARQCHAQQPRCRRSSLRGNSYPANWAAIGFVDLAGGNYRLASTSAYITAGTGGSTPGADIDALGVGESVSKRCGRGVHVHRHAVVSLRHRRAATASAWA